MVFGKKQPRFAEVISKPIPEQQKSVKEMVEPKEKNPALIVSAEILENGKVRTIIISNESIGEVGESFEVED